MTTAWGETTDGENGGDIDLYAEVYVGRASAENADEMANFVFKTLAYESSTSAYKKKILMVGEHLGFGGVSEYAKNSLEESEREFQSWLYNHRIYKRFLIFRDTLYQKRCELGTNDIMVKSNLNQYGIINHLGHAGHNHVMHRYLTGMPILSIIHYHLCLFSGLHSGQF
ncbi:MAG: C25 family cysteine peptidase [Desulfobacterales bacterium]